jgi:hypothetical protein
MCKSKRQESRPTVKQCFELHAGLTWEKRSRSTFPSYVTEGALRFVQVWQKIDTVNQIDKNVKDSSACASTVETI